VFKTVKVQRTNPVTYLLESATYPDIYFMEKVSHRKGNKVYVKWLKFDGSHNSWIHKDNTI